MEDIKIHEFLEKSYGDGSGGGCGNGYGSGYGSGDGSCYGSGYGNMIKKAKKHNIYNVDGINTIFYSIHKNVAKCAIFNEDFTFTPCYVVKGGGHFAHGETIKKAMKDLEKKIFNDMGIEEKIDAFLGELELDKKYPAHKFYEWHHKLTGSCEMGRKTFVENHNIDLDKDEFTVEEFIELTQNDFGGEVIKELKERISDDKWR